jgi:hypothetical protein
VRTRAVLCSHARPKLPTHLPVHRPGVELALMRRIEIVADVINNIIIINI